MKMDGTGVNGENIRDDIVIGKQMNNGSVPKGSGNSLDTANHGYDDGTGRRKDAGKTFMDDGAKIREGSFKCSGVKPRFVSGGTIHKRLKISVSNSVKSTASLCRR